MHAWWTFPVMSAARASVIDNPAHPIMELDSGALVPTPFITSRDAGVVTIDPPEGLFDLEGE